MSRSSSGGGAWLLMLPMTSDAVAGVFGAFGGFLGPERNNSYSLTVSLGRSNCGTRLESYDAELVLSEELPLHACI